MPSSTTIRNTVAQMMGITGASERVASSVLKKHNFKLDAACDAPRKARKAPKESKEPEESKERSKVVPQEEEDPLEGNSEVILDQEPPSDYASRVHKDQPELQERRRPPKPKQPEPDTNTPDSSYVLEIDPLLNSSPASLRPNQLTPPSNLSPEPIFPHRILPLPVPTGQPLRNPGPYYQRAQSSPLRNSSMPTSQNIEQSPLHPSVQHVFQRTPVTNDMRNQALHSQHAGPSTYQNGQPAVHNAALTQPTFQNSPLVQGAWLLVQGGHFQNGLPNYQNGYIQSGLPYYQNGYVHNSQPSYQHGYVQNGQPYYVNGYGYFQSGLPYYASGGKTASAPTPVEDKSSASLSSLFDKYRGLDDDKDSIAVDGTMAYLTDLAVNLEDASSLIPLEIVQAPAIGEMTRDGFVKGWQKAGAESSSTLDTIPKQKAYIASQTKLLSSDTAFFKRVYKHTFVCSKERSQKALPLENALVYWEMLFSPPGMPWASATTDWLKLWLEFLNAKWTKTVNKDMWNQTLEFSTKSRGDEEMSFWSEEGAWPSVIDDFVVWVREKRGGGAVADNMETD
ncbi:hypothetical protein V494_06675 [Pseudogymnoascus sp. VKM F-4513 (FW-928)]|nr:hypothetical protein V494_06675 [Pseudogymnoascus sp. VKM F-4513 (FW-928)]